MKLNKIPIIISIALLMIASFSSPLEVGYYTFLRLVVCGTSTYLSYFAYKLNKTIWLWVEGLIALLFNPFIPIHFKITTWRGVDFVVAVIFVIYLIRFRKVAKSKD